MRSPRSRRHRNGYSLFELMVVVLLVGIFSSLVILTIDDDNATDQIILEANTSEIADAIRFARSLAIKSGNPHGVFFDANNQEVRVYRIDIDAPTPQLVYDVYHPVEMKPYLLQLNTDRFPAEMASITIKYVDHGGNFVRIDFMATTGTPMRMHAGNIYMLQVAQINVEHNDAIMSVIVTPYNGRVTVQ